MRRYLKLIVGFWGASVMRGTELRASFFVSFLDSATALLLSVLFFEIVYTHVHSIAGWSKYGVLLLLGIFSLQMAILNMIVRPGLVQMGRLVHRGDLDGYLTKPIPSQFTITFLGFDVFRAFDLMLALLLAVYAILKLGISPTPIQWLMAAIHFGAALVIVYSIWYISLTFVVWTTVLSSWISLVPNIFSFSQYPASIYKGKLKLFFMTALPIAVVVNSPASSLLGRMSWMSVGYSVLLAALFLGLSIAFWNKALRFYSSASS